MHSLIECCGANSFTVKTPIEMEADAHGGLRTLVRFLPVTEERTRVSRHTKYASREAQSGESMLQPCHPLTLPVVENDQLGAVILIYTLVITRPSHPRGATSHCLTRHHIAISPRLAVCNSVHRKEGEDLPTSA